MSSKKAERRDETTTAEIGETVSTREHSPEYQRATVNRALDETKDNIRKSIDEARKEIPRYTQAANDYQEQTIQAAREIADNYIESQKEIINSLQSAWLSHIEATNRLFTTRLVSPRNATEIYANMVSRSADNIIAATKLVNNMMFANMDMFKALMQQAKDNAKELSRIGVNSARTFEQTSRDTATATTRIGSGGDNTSTTSRVYIEREQ
jgi:bacterioferritin (cytochrome b1)